MTVKEFSALPNITAITLPEQNKEIGGAYIGDLLSWVMGKAKENDIWITIMSNINTIAVASLTGCACVLFTEDVAPTAELIDLANQKGINLLSTSLSSYSAAAFIYKELGL